MLTKSEGKDVVLSETAIEILDKIYPLPSPVQVVIDHESRDQLIKTQATVIQLQKQINQQTGLVAEAKFQRYLLDQKDKELEEQRKLLDMRSQEIEKLQANIKIEQDRSAAATAEVADVKTKADKQLQESREQTTQAQTERDAAKEEIKRLEAELAAAQEEANSFKRSFLGFYRKKK